MRKLYIVGIGPGSKEYLLPRAEEAIRGCDVLIGGKRNLELFRELDKEKVVIGSSLEDVSSYINTNASYKKIAVLVTGDPGLFSVMSYLKENLPDMELIVLPGVSSLQYLCCKQRMAWDSMFITSLHGRQQPAFFDSVRENSKVGMFTGGEYKPDGVCKLLIEKGFSDIKVTVGENLSYSNERIVTGTLEEISKEVFDDLSIMILEHNVTPGYHKANWEFTGSCIPDGMFIRGNVPMTKEEVRAVSISKLRLLEDSLVFDIGAGTGSVSIECGIRCKRGKVFAIEKNPLALELIGENIREFSVDNIEVIEGEAPSVLEKLPRPDRIFIGGSSGNMDKIIHWISEAEGYIRVVINTVTLESTCEALSALDRKGFDVVEIVNVAVSQGRLAGGKHLMQAMNPVYIISAEKNHSGKETDL